MLRNTYQIKLIKIQLNELLFLKKNFFFFNFCNSLEKIKQISTLNFHLEYLSNEYRLRDIWPHDTLIDEPPPALGMF